MKPIILTEQQLPEEQYHAESGIGDGKFITRSILHAYAQSPRLCREMYVNKSEFARKEQNQGMNLGNIFEVLCLGNPDSLVTFPEHYPNAEKLSRDESAKYRLSNEQYLDENPDIVEVTKDDGKRVVEVIRLKPWHTSAGYCKTWTIQQESQGVHPVKDHDVKKAAWLLDLANENELFQAYVTNRSEEQVTVRWQDQQTGLLCQVRIDFLARSVFLGDLKTGIKSPDQFVTSCLSYGYHIQAAMYADAWRIAAGENLPFCFAYQQTGGALDTRVMTLPSKLHLAGFNAYHDSLEGIAAKRFDVSQIEPEEATMSVWQEKSLGL